MGKGRKDMSADNGIYICKFKGGWKVAHAQAIENIYWWKNKKGQWEERKKINPYVLSQIFKRSKLFKDKIEAVEYAHKLCEAESQYGPVEYGVCEIERDVKKIMEEKAEARKRMKEYFETFRGKK